MQIRPDALAAALSRGLPALTWIHGDEDLLVIEAADLVRRAARAAGYLERLVFQVDRSFKLDALIAETQSLSLFASQRLIELRLANKPTKELGAGLAAILATLDDSTRLLVSSVRLDRAVTETAWFGTLEPRITLVPIAGVEHAQLPAWIGQRLAAQQQKADPDTLRMLAERVEGNLLAAHQEVRSIGQGLVGQAGIVLQQVQQAQVNAIQMRGVVQVHHDPAYPDDWVAAQEAAAKNLFPDSHAAFEGMEIVLSQRERDRMDVKYVKND